MAGRTIKVDEQNPLHQKLIDMVSSRISLAEREQTQQHDKWTRAEELVTAFVPESEADAERRNTREVEGEPKYTTIMLPYTYALLMSAHTYWTSVFFARDPVHQFKGLHGETEMQVQAVEALVQYQTEIGEMMAPYYLWLYDAGKYGLGILGHYWCEEYLHYGEIVEMDMGDGRGPQMYQTTQEVEGYKGNRVFNVSPYDFLPDPRVPVSRFHDGEFCILICRLGWDKILERQRDGYFINVDKIKDHISVDRNSTMGATNLRRPDFGKTLIDDYGSEKHPAGAVFYECYIRLIPSEWGLGNSNYMQMWCITITEDKGLVVGASPLGYIHCKFPVDVIEPEVEGYGVYNRGIPEIMEGVQNTMDWLINTHFFNVRAALNNQFIVDPSKLVVKDVANSGKPGFIWRLRPEAYGADIGKMFMQIPVTDVTRTHLTDMQTMLGVGERTLGINDQIMGVLSGTNRKTATEVRTSTGFGVNRQKTICEYMSAGGFSMHARKVLQNTQQFYNYQTKLRIVGDLAVAAGTNFINVTPEDIAGFYGVIPVDGTLPIDRMAQANLWKEILMGITRMPSQIAGGFDMMKIFSWTASLGGLKNINQMRVQVLPPGMGPPPGMIQMPGQQPAALPPPSSSSKPPGQGSPSASTEAGLNALMPPSQMPGAGTSGGY